MRAPRACADSMSSSTSITAPSPSTKPARSLSNGREAFSGSSWCSLVSAPSSPKPMTSNHVVSASLPPASMTLASPSWTRRKASPSACEDAVQAVETENIGPSACARRPIVAVITFWSRVRTSSVSTCACSCPSDSLIVIDMSTRVSIPGRPTLPAIPIPTSCGSYAPSTPASSSASSAAATPNPAARERCSRSLASGRRSARSKPLTVPAICTGKVEASKVSIFVTPLRPAFSACQVSSALLPTGVTAPIPVTATRRSMSGIRLREHALQALGVLERRKRLRVDQRAHHVLGLHHGRAVHDGTTGEHRDLFVHRFHLALELDHVARADICEELDRADREQRRALAGVRAEHHEPRAGLAEGLEHQRRRHHEIVAFADPEFLAERAHLARAHGLGRLPFQDPVDQVKPHAG